MIFSEVSGLHAQLGDFTLCILCIGQGTAGGALVSQANLDKGLMRYFSDSEDEIQYGSVRLQPLAYQDDVLRGSKDVTTAQKGNIRMCAGCINQGP